MRIYNQCIENAQVEHTQGTKDRKQYKSKREPEYKTSASTKGGHCVPILAACRKTQHAGKQTCKYANY